MIRAIIDKQLLINKNTIQVNRLLRENEEYKVNEETELLFENSYLFAFAKYENDKITELTEEEAKLKSLIKLQSNEAIIDNKLIKLAMWERVENNKIIVDIELKKTYINNRMIALKKERVQLKKDREEFIKFDEDITEIYDRITDIGAELEELEKIGGIK